MEEPNLINLWFLYMTYELTWFMILWQDIYIYMINNVMLVLDTVRLTELDAHDLFSTSIHIVLLGSCDFTLSMWHTLTLFHLYFIANLSFLFVLLVGFNPLNSKSYIIDKIVTPTSNAVSCNAVNRMWYAVCNRFDIWRSSAIFLESTSFIGSVSSKTRQSEISKSWSKLFIVII